MDPLTDALKNGDSVTADGTTVQHATARTYLRYADFSARMFATVDPSPYPKGLNLSAKERESIRRSELTPETADSRRIRHQELRRPENLKRLLAIGSNERRWMWSSTQGKVAEGRGFGMLYDTLPRIPKDIQRRNRRRLDLAMNKIVSGSLT